MFFKKKRYAYYFTIAVENGQTGNIITSCKPIEKWSGSALMEAVDMVAKKGGYSKGLLLNAQPISYKACIKDGNIVEGEKNVDKV